MNKFYGTIIAILVLFSCSEPDTSSFDDAELKFADQKWELVRMSGSMVNSTTTGADMEWQEYYVFSLDGIFQKIRKREGIVSEAAGTFEFVAYQNDEADYLELTYTMGLGLIVNCSGDQKEVFIYRSASEISNTWMACDGPELDYRLVVD